MLLAMERKPGFGQQDTIEELLRASKRPTRAVPLRREFVQLGTQERPEPGPLAKFVTRHDEAALQLFLLHRAVASRAPWTSARGAGVWARALGFATSDQTLNTPSVSRVFRRLDETHDLITRDRSKRRLEATALQEDGSRKPYLSPASGYFRLPYAYWEDRWYLKLSMPGIAVLLIGMSLKPGFILPPTQAQRWYGISGDTMSKGVAELKTAKLLKTKRGKERDWLTGSGWRHEQKHTLQAPFDRPVPVPKEAVETE